MKVAIFGGSATVAGEGAYEDARFLGRLLGEHGDTVLTGAYSGVMEAASRGCKEGGGHVIGFTCTQIEALRGVNANPWVQEVRRFDTLRDRMHALIDACEAAVVMPGGVGTLCELLVMWNEMIIDQKAVRPLLIVGKEWQSVLAEFINTFGCYIGQKEWELVSLVPDVTTAFDHLSNPPQ
ncbi:MAG: LOG family protein [Anaerolineaceae bacterium]